MEVIALQSIAKQNLSVVLNNILCSLDLIETAGVMSLNLTRAGTVILSGQRVVAGQLLIPYAKLEGGQGNLMFLTSDGDLPFWDQFTSTQTLLYGSPADLAAVRATPVPLVVNGIVAKAKGTAVGVAIAMATGHHTP